VIPPGIAVATYFVTAVPPVLAGPVQETLIAPLLIAAATPAGGLGTPIGVTMVLTAGALLPVGLAAATPNV
jgi:hypothetical protein